MTDIECSECGSSSWDRHAATCESCAVAREALAREGTRLLLAGLQREVEGYLNNPGCNIPQRAARMRRLRWALKESGYDDGE